MTDINAHCRIVYEEQGTLSFGLFPTAEQADDVSSLFDKRVMSGSGCTEFAGNILRVAAKDDPGNRSPAIQSAARYM